MGWLNLIRSKKGKMIIQPRKLNYITSTSISVVKKYFFFSILEMEKHLHISWKRRLELEF